MTKRIFLAISLAMVCSAANAGLTPYTSEGTFLGALTGATGTEDFESFTGVGGVLGGPDASTVTLNFVGVTTTGTISYVSGGPTAGQNPDAFISNWSSDYGAVSGTQFLNADNVLPNSLTITFSEAVSGFGFYLLDAGDFGPNGVNPENMMISTSAGDTAMIPTSGNPTGTQQYFGIVDDMGGSFTSVTFDQRFLSDIFGLDDLTVQVFEAPVVDPPDPNVVPEPASVIVWLSLLVTGVVYARRRKDAA